MCGICGDVTFNGAPASPAAVARMMEALSRRGPDANGMVVRGRYGFGHQRLKIIDLSDKAEQPMVDSDLGLTRLQWLHLQLPGTARRVGGPRLRLLFHWRHRGHPEGLARLGPGLRQALPWHVRFCHRRAQQRPGGPGP